MSEPIGSRTSQFDYPLPESRIAQQPVEPRDASRLMVLNRATGTIAHHRFRDIVQFIPAGDAIVVNTTKVFRARLLGVRASGGPAEILLLRAINDDHYEAMIHPGGKLKPGRVVTIAPGFEVEIVASTPQHTRIVKLRASVSIPDAIDTYGHIPLPPYITRGDNDNDALRYQTVYANQAGSVAAPTAGLHFTPDLLAQLDDRGVERIDVMLHVGAGTFRPIQDEDPALHVMHNEWCEVTEHAAAAMNTVRARGGKLWAVGTTSVRTLESCSTDNGIIQPIHRDTNIFLRPPYVFKSVDHLLTNFHLPKSTLIMLVAAFAGYELTMHAYRVAVEERYRFYSYGDAMLII